MKIRVRTLEGYYGEQFAKAAGLSSLINQLIRLDKISAPRYLVSSRRVLFKFIEHFKNRNDTNSKNFITNYELVTPLPKKYWRVMDMNILKKRCNHL